MLIYLDTNIVQYCADFEDFIFRADPLPQRIPAKLRKELIALRELVEIELQLEYRDTENRWDIAAPRHLIKELFAGRPTEQQKDVYTNLIKAWCDMGRDQHIQPADDEIALIEITLRPLKFKDTADRWHLAEAIALQATWFLTNDRNIIDSTRRITSRGKNKMVGIPQDVGTVQGVRVAYPSECIERMSFHPVWGLMQHE